VRNGKGGPRTRCSDLVPKAHHPSSDGRCVRERTTGFHIGGGAIFGNPRRGSPDDSGAAEGLVPDAAKEKKGPRGPATCLRRRHEGHEGCATHSATGGKRGRRRASKVSIDRYQGHGGTAGKAHDPQRLRSLVNPRCHLGSSREEADGPEGPMNFREAAEVPWNRGQPFRRETL
jgi:hypothetical protein